MRPLDTRAPPVPYVTSKHRLDSALGQAIKAILPAVRLNFCAKVEKFPHVRATGSLSGSRAAFRVAPKRAILRMS